jgi:hypothetical protein
LTGGRTDRIEKQIKTAEQTNRHKNWQTDGRSEGQLDEQTDGVKERWVDMKMD